MSDFWLNLISIVVGSLAALLLYKKRSLAYLQFFQQEDYTAGRYFQWYMNKSAWDRRASSSIAIPFFILCVFHSAPVALLLTIFLAVRLIWIARSELDPIHTGKIKLKMTERAKRIYRLALLFFSLLLIATSALLAQVPPEQNVIAFFWLAQLVLVQTHMVWIALANALLTPYENSLQEGFANEARAVLKKCNPIVIGITGSYGKTSTKVLLKEILGAVSPTFSTPGSINSYMGVTREIRERLKPEHKFAVIEMGAYYIGSIKKMCSLTPPAAGIVTTVGVMHLERFGGQEAVYQAKSELAQAIPADGVLVVNGDNEYCRKMAIANPKKVTLLYGLEPEKGHLDAVLYNITATEKGSSFKIKWKDQEYDGFAGLLGRPMLANVLAAFTMACAQGMAPEVVLAAIRNVRTESNRLEPVRASIASLSASSNGHSRPGQILRLNDAYNSNPVGFAAALEVLANMPGGRKVLVTPGMIELGDRQEEENRQAASKAAAICDLVCVVGETNKLPLTEGLKQGGMPADRCKEFYNMQAALAHLATEYCQDGDIVLIENDLPDLFETPVKF